MISPEIKKRAESIKAKIEKLIGDGRLDEAIAALQRFEEMLPGDPDACSMHAVIHIIEGDLDKAEAVLQNGIIICGDKFDLLYNMAYISEQKGNNRKAYDLYIKAKSISNETQRLVIDNALANLDENVVPVGRSLKILHGTMEIANQMYTQTRGLRNSGMQADTYNYYPNYLGYKSDFAYDIQSVTDNEKKQQNIYNIIQNAISHYDIFHFHFGTSLSPDNSDIPILADCGKQLYMQHWGSDVRLFSKSVKLSKYVKVKNTDEDVIKRKMSSLAKHIDNCIVCDYELYEYVKEYYNNVIILPLAIDPERFIAYEKPDNPRPVVVHAPTSPLVKGTEYLNSAVEELKGKYDFDYILVSNMSNEQATAIYRKADIIIDQLLIGSYGVFAIEAMALGKPVISWICDFMRDKYPEDLPIISANPENIRQKLELLLKDKELRNECGINGRCYAEKYHNMNMVGKDLSNIYTKHNIKNAGG